LQARLAQLEAPPAKPPPRVPDERPIVRYAIETSRQELLPDQQQLIDLLRIVWRVYPQLKPPPADERNYLFGFQTCLMWLMQARRQPTLNTKYYPSFWVDEVLQWCRDAQRSSRGVDGRTFAAAVVAAGDVVFREDFGEYGLQFGGRESPVSDAGWRAVLRDGKPRDPVPVKLQTVVPRKMIHSAG
jgi:hypothetical protein